MRILCWSVFHPKHLDAVVDVVTTDIFFKKLTSLVDIVHLFYSFLFLKKVIDFDVECSLLLCGLVRSVLYP